MISGRKSFSRSPAIRIWPASVYSLLNLTCLPVGNRARFPSRLAFTAAIEPQRLLNPTRFNEHVGFAPPVSRAVFLLSGVEPGCCDAACGKGISFRSWNDGSF